MTGFRGRKRNNNKRGTNQKIRSTATRSTTQQQMARQVIKNSSVLSQGGRPSGPFHAYVANDPFRPWYSARLRYTSTVQYTAGAVGVYGTEQIYRLNSLFDPDFSLGGTQPYGFDQLSELYKRYKVNAVTIQFEIYDPSVDGMLIGIQVQPPGGTATVTGKNVDVIKEQPMSITRNISDSGSQRLTVRQYFPMHSILGVSPIQFKADMTEYTAPVTADPNQIPLVRIAAANKAGGGGTVWIRTSIHFHSQFYDRKVLAQS